MSGKNYNLSHTKIDDHIQNFDIDDPTKSHPNHYPHNFEHEPMLDGSDDIVRRFIVTKEGAKIALGTTTKFLEIMYNGNVRIRDAKKATLNQVIKRPLLIFQDSGKKQARIHMDSGRKKRSFKFSSITDKNLFFKELKHYRIRSYALNRNRASVEPFQFAPYEVVAFFIRDACISRSGSYNDYDRHLIAITNYRMVIVDIMHENMKQNQLNRGDQIIPAFTVAHHSVYDYNIDNDTVITIDTKDYRTITIDLGGIKNSTLRIQSLQMMKRYV